MAVCLLPSEIKVHLGQKNCHRYRKPFRSTKPTLYNEQDAKLLTGPCKIYTPEEIEAYIKSNGGN